MNFKRFRKNIGGGLILFVVNFDKNFMLIENIDILV